MQQVTDPVCGMRVNPATAPAMLVHAGHTHYFCSTGCQQKFSADPSRYEGADAASGGEGVEMERHEPPHTTTGGITAPKFGSAGSGGLEYEPLPEAHGDGSPPR